MSDAELSRRLRRSRDHVRNQRIALHIPVLISYKAKYWTRTEEKLLGTAPDALIAKKLARTEYGVGTTSPDVGDCESSTTSARVTPRKQDRLLGTMPDYELARRLGPIFKRHPVPAHLPSHSKVLNLSVGIGCWRKNHFWGKYRTKEAATRLKRSG